MKSYFWTVSIAALFAAHFPGFAQADSNHFNFDKNVFEVEGDLNKDKLADKAVVTQDTSSEKAPYRLQIFFKQPNGKWKLVVSSTQIIQPQYPNGRNGYATGEGFSEVVIKRGVLNVIFGLLRGHYEHKFRFQNGGFELIGFSMVGSDGHGEMTTIDFNLSTGVRIEKTERYDMDKVLSEKTEKIWIRPLPKLQDVVPMEGDFF